MLVLACNVSLEDTISYEHFLDKTEPKLGEI